VRDKAGGPLMTVTALSQHTVLCAWYSENGRIQHSPYFIDELQLVAPAASNASSQQAS
jgi:uncharacterized protein YodC (DUF2158 family)